MNVLNLFCLQVASWIAIMAHEVAVKTKSGLLKCALFYRNFRELDGVL
jgi:hypothetical protein